jgi:hypothetical protein
MVTQRARRWLALALALAFTACKPELDGRPSLVRSERVLALRSSPAEAAPGASVMYDALFVGPEGPGAEDALAWALCNERKALTESGSISGECVQLESSALSALELATDGVQANVPRDACETFGPTPKTPKAGEPNLRPVDPDTTGGFYQPVRVAVETDETRFAVGVTRLTCALGGATQEQSAAYNRRRRPNENPGLESLLLVHADGLEEPLVDAGESALVVEPGERVHLRADWAACPTEPSCGDGICSPEEQECADDCREPHGCTGSEAYVYFDPLSRQLVDRREALRVAWFATAGAFEHERTGRGADEATDTSTDNAWQAPDDATDIRLWVVLRDDRGGVGWGSYRLQVQ